MCIAVDIAAALAAALAAKHETQDLLRLTGLQVANHVRMTAGEGEEAGSGELTTSWSQQGPQAGAAAPDAQQPYDTQAQQTLARA